MLVIIGEKKMRGVSIASGVAMVELVCGHMLSIRYREFLMNKDGLSTWTDNKTRPHTCDKCGVEYVTE